MQEQERKFKNYVREIEVWSVQGDDITCLETKLAI